MTLNLLNPNSKQRTEQESRQMKVLKMIRSLLHMQLVHLLLYSKDGTLQDYDSHALSTTINMRRWHVVSSLVYARRNVGTELRRGKFA